MLSALVLLAMDPRAALDAGDAAWRAGDRGEARAAWREAAEAEDPAVQAMAEVRLLRVSGNLGWMVHGPRADAALARCPAVDPWCDLAEADYDLTLRDLGLTRDAGQAGARIRRAAPALPEAAALRERWMAAPREVWPPGPGTWTLGLGVLGGPGLGLGGTLRLVHPDLGWERVRLDLAATGTTRGAAALAAGWRTPGSPYGTGSLLASQGPLDTYAGGALQTWTVTQLGATAALGLRAGELSAWAGPSLRLEGTEELMGGHGVLGGARWELAGGRASAKVAGELALADYDLARLSLDLRGRVPIGALTLAGRALSELAPWTDEHTPFWRLPSAGGSELLRGAPAGRYRGEALILGATELRAELSPSWELVAFGELAWLPGAEEPGPHPGAGVGARLRLPPRPDNTLRLDLGFTDAGWGLVAGWGEAL